MPKKLDSSFANKVLFTGDIESQYDDFYHKIEHLLPDSVKNKYKWCIDHGDEEGKYQIVMEDVDNYLQKIAPVGYKFDYVEKEIQTTGDIYQQYGFYTGDIGEEIHEILENTPESTLYQNKNINSGDRMDAIDMDFDLDA